MNARNGSNPTLGRVLVIGDSITLGATEVRGNDIVETASPTFVDRLRNHFGQRVEFIIDADTHRTTTAAIAGVESNLSLHRPDLLILTLGGNDADLDWKRFVLSDGAVVRHRVAVDRYEANLRRVAEICQASKLPLIIGDVCSMNLAMRGPYLSQLANRDVSAMLQRGGGQPESDRALATYRDALDRLAIQCSFAVAHFGRAMDAMPPADVLSIDGVHPNANGHRIIAECLAPLIENPAGLRAAGAIDAASRPVRRKTFV